jgi:peroxiredoxin family protein
VITNDSGSLDRLLAAMSIATGAAAMGTKVHLPLTYWATTAMRKRTQIVKKPFVEKMLGWILPSVPFELKLSTMNAGGLGTAMPRRRMKDMNIADLDEPLRMAEELEVNILICEMSMALTGMSIEDLREYLGMEQCGVATFMSRALDSKVAFSNGTGTGTAFPKAN